MAQTRKQLLSGVRDRLNDGIDFIKRDDIVIISKRSSSCLPEERFENQGKTYCEINKLYGSDLAQIWNARDQINRMLGEGE